MRRFSSGSRRFTYVLTVCFLVSLLVYFQRSGISNFPQGALYAIQNAISIAAERARHLWNGYFVLVDAQEESQRLRRALSEAQLENQRLNAQMGQWTRLQTLRDYQIHVPFSLTMARVIGREPMHWYQTLLLDRGEREGIAVDAGVITPAGVIGVVIKTHAHYAQVLLVTDRAAGVAAKVERTQDMGIVTGLGSGPDGEGLLGVKYLPLSAQVAAGDTLVTSGLGGIFQEGIPIGRIHHVGQKPGEMFLIVTARPSVSFSKMREVFVLTSPKRLPRFESMDETVPLPQ